MTSDTLTSTLKYKYLAAMIKYKKHLAAMNFFIKKMWRSCIMDDNDLILECAAPKDSRLDKSQDHSSYFPTQILIRILS